MQGTFLPRFSIFRWLSLILERISGAFRRCLGYLVPWDCCAQSGGGTRNQSIVLPPTKEQVNDSISQFLSRVDRDAVSGVMSRHTGRRPWSIFKELHGGFNVCFFMRLDNNEFEYIIRIPIAPVVISSREKMQSEIATMRHIERNTTIPISQILAHGTDDYIVPGAKTPFIIMSVIRGQQLDNKTLLESSTAQRRNLFTDLVDFMAQLRQLQFYTGGSLVSNGGHEIIGPIHSMAANEYQRKSAITLHQKTADNAGELLEYHLDILQRACQLPGQGVTRNTAKLKVFAFHSIAREARAIVDTKSTTFVLMHMDLQLRNIFIDENFHIIGLVDWEFSHTVPLELFCPPSWITGHDPDMSQELLSRPYGPTRETILAEFCDVLAQGKENSSWELLWNDWFGEQDKGSLHMRSAIFHVLREPSSLVYVYYRSIFPMLYGNKAERETVVDSELGQTERAEVERLLQSSENYVQYLEREGLVVEDEASKRRREWNMKLQKYREKERGR